MKKYWKKLVKVFSSLKLAVLVILSLAIVSVIGTLVEARYDARVAQKLVYHSIYMYIILWALIINLIFVMIDRWPWKKHHLGFVLAHIGIIILLLGSWVTKKYGIDGSMSFDIGQSSQFVILPEEEVAVYATFGGDRYTQLYKQDVDFISNPLEGTEKVFHLGEQKLVVKKYIHFALPNQEILRSKDQNQGPALRFLLQNQHVNFSDWLVLGKKSLEEVNMGPAKVVLSIDKNYRPSQSGNELVVHPKGDKLQVKVYTRGKLTRSKLMSSGENTPTGWMGLDFKVLNFYQQAEKKITYKEAKQKSELTHAALLVEFSGHEQWVGLNSVARFFTAGGAYIMSYAQKKIKLQFPLLLKKFDVGKYQGTNRPSSYKSVVYHKDIGEVTISMNNPLKHQNFTFYQASYSQDEKGRPVASILSVNHDPGRFLKYLGSSLIVLGATMLFYFKKILVKKYIKSTHSGV